MNENTTPINVVTQMKEDYLAYSMAVLLGRAVPDLYDGLKPVQRRVLQTMFEENLKPDGRFVKCARVTGLTMAYFHPHSGAYGALVNMATPWNNNIPWIDGHGNFGSTVDGPAAERYTECKLRPSAVDILLQNKETWETQPNYDGSRQEAIRFNTAIPSVLLNGDSGIAVGYATRLAPHNIRAIVEATKLACKFAATDKAYAGAVAKARDVLIPDFPTGCDIIVDENLEEYKKTGNGTIRTRAKAERGIQKRDGRAKDRITITFTKFPPHVNPEKLGEQIKNELEKGRLDGIAEILDESDLTGDRLTVVGKPGVDGDTLERGLYAYTDLDSRISAKSLVIDGLKPVELSPVEICQRWFAWRMDRLEEQFRHEQDLKMARLEIVMGFLKAIDKLDAVIKVIRSSTSHKEALIKLVDRPFKFTADQARAILEMRLRQLTNLDTEELVAENAALDERLAALAILIEDRNARSTFCFKQMDEIAKRHGEARRSALIESPVAFTKVAATEKRELSAPKPRFMKVDMVKGMAEQAKGPRGALILEAKDKVVFVTESGVVKKVHAAYKGPISTEYGAIALARREAEVQQRRYLAVFKLEGKMRAMSLAGEDLCRTTSSGKNWLPDGAEFVSFGEGPVDLKWVSAKKQQGPITMANVKEGRPGAKGMLIANLSDLILG